jgi:hypothetical protein
VVDSPGSFISPYLTGEQNLLMVQIPEELHEKIKTIRMSLHFSIHDCAKLLGI